MNYFTTILLLFFLSLKINAQNTNLSRLQYMEFKWKYSSIGNTNLYYPENYDSSLSRLFSQFKDVHAFIEDTLQISIPKNLNIIIYSSEYQLNQSNIGFTKIQLFPEIRMDYIPNKIILFLEVNDKKTIETYETKLIYQCLCYRLYSDDLNELASSWKESKYAEDFIKALASYLSEGWSFDNELRWQENLMAKSQKTFQDLLLKDGVLTYKSLLNYIQVNYGKQFISVILSQIQRGRSFNKSTQELFKKQQWELEQDCLVFYVTQFLNNLSKNQKQLIKISQKVLIPNILIINNQSIVYWKMDKYAHRLCTYNLVDEREKTILKIPFILNGKKDQTPKIFRISSSENEFILFYWLKGKYYKHSLNLRILDKPILSKKIWLRDIDAVTNFQWLESRNMGLFIASKSGMYNLYSLTKSGLNQLSFTNSDKQNLLLINTTNGTNIVFETNQKNKDFNNYNNHEKLDSVYHIIFWSIEGILNRNWTDTLYGFELYLNNNDKMISSNDENYPSLINLENKKESKLIDLNDTSSIYTTKNRIVDYIKIGQELLLIEQSGTGLEFSKINIANLSKKKSLLFMKYKEPIKNDTHIEESTSKKIWEVDSLEMTLYRDSLEKAKYYNPNSSKKYKWNFANKQSSLGLNNAILINRYQPYMAQQGQFHQAGLGALAMSTYSDIFENYVIDIAYRLPIQYKGSDYFIRIAYKEKRLDWHLTFWRHAERTVLHFNSDWFFRGGKYVPQYVNQKSFYTELKLSYPLNALQSIGLDLAWKQDHNYYLALDTFSLHFPDTIYRNLFARASYFLDKKNYILPDIYKGWRSTVFGEYHINMNEGLTFAHLGVDLRFYQPLVKNISWSSRLQAATSFGNTLGILYSLGGNLQQIEPLVDSSVNFSPLDHYTYISFAEGMRGFRQNTRFGRSFFIINTEIRIPIMNTFFNYYSAWTIMNNLKVVPYLDIGNAYSYSTTVKNKPIIYDYGLGLHSRLFNYSFRVDFSLLSERSKNYNYPVITLSLGENF